MSDLNPFKMISNIENQNIQFKEIGILEAIGVGILYMMLVSLELSSLIHSKSLLLSSIFEIFILILIFLLEVVSFYKLYTVEIHEKTDLSKDAKKFTIKNIAFLTIAVVGIRLSIYCIIAYLMLFQRITIPSVFNSINARAPYFIVYVCILGPSMEGFIFRGVILGGLLKKYSIKISILVSALLFGIRHANVIQFITGFFLGICLGYLYVKTHSICFCMFSHILFNTLELYYFKWNPNLLLLSLCFIIGLIFIMWGFKKLTSNINKNMKLSRKRVHQKLHRI